MFRLYNQINVEISSIFLRKIHLVFGYMYVGSNARKNATKAVVQTLVAKRKELF